MANPKKPIVFLSHSSQDKSQLVALKNLLDDRAAGALEFFLSSDGESIEFGRNWMVKISDALSHANLMFVFLSPRAADSKWIHFEAGNAHAKNVQVVPVCLPGMDFSRVTPPLSLLQGFNLHSPEAMRNLARMCNKRFEMKINESFSSDDFKRVFGASPYKAGGFFGGHSFAVEQVKFHVAIRLPKTAEVNLIPVLQKIAKAARVECMVHEKIEQGQTPRMQIDLPGCCIGALEDIRNYGGEPEPTKEVSVYGSLSPDLFHLNAPVLDKWFEQCPAFTSWDVSIHLARQFRSESERHQLTTKLYKSDIKLVDGSHLAFDGLTFELAPHAFSAISFKCKGTLNDKRLPKLVERLFALDVLFEAPARSELDDSLSGYLFRSQLI
jgi:hypothetical protein